MTTTKPRSKLAKPKIAAPALAKSTIIGKPIPVKSRGHSAPSSDAPASGPERFAARGPLAAKPLLDPPGTIQIAPRKIQPRPVPQHWDAARVSLSPIDNAPQEPLAPSLDSARALHPSTPWIDAPALSPKFTLAQRLEAARLVRQEQQAIPIEPAQPATDAHDFVHEIASESVIVKAPASPAANPAAASRRVNAPRSAALGKAPLSRAVPKPDPHRLLSMRNVFLGFALAYIEYFEHHIGGPVMTLWRYKSSFVSGFVHVFVPFFMAYGAANWSPETQAIFLGGSSLSNLGKLCWLYVVCGFLWTLLYMVADRLLLSFKHDGAHFERIGRGFMSPHGDE